MIFIKEQEAPFKSAWDPWEEDSVGSPLTPGSFCQDFKVWSCDPRGLSISVEGAIS